MQDPVQVVGGQQVQEPGHFDFQIAILKLGVMYCSGFILNKKFAGTAGHCLKNRIPADYQVGYGSYDIRKLQKSSISDFFVHQDFDAATGDFDVGLIKILNSFAGNHVAFIGLANQKLPAGAPVIVSGWGDTKISKRSSGLLNYAEIHVMDLKDCFHYYGRKDYEVTENMMCTMDEFSGSCVGDSGGPLTYNGSVIGIVSWGDSSCRNYPSVYTDVSSPKIQEYFRTYLTVED